MVTDLIVNSGDGVIRMSEDMTGAFELFTEFMYDAVYRNPTAKGEESKVLGILGGIFEHYVAHPDGLPPEFLVTAYTEGLERAVCDYIAGMTDDYALTVYSSIFIPAAWSVK